MEQLIRFRKLADSLSQNEFDSFLKTLNLIDIRSIILEGLFSSFHTQIQNDSNSTDLTETIQIISKIIRSRNSKQVKEIESKKEATKLSLNDLPLPLIGECASYLPFIDYHSLQNVSRSVFIGCNDPNTVIKIDHTIFERNYESRQHLKLRKYQNVIDFEINMHDFSKMTSIHNLSLSPNVKSLSLSRVNVTGMKKFLNTKGFNFDRIEILKLQYWQDVSDDVNTDSLQHFKNIKFLELYNCFLIFANEQFSNKIFKNLQGLSLYQNTDTNAVNFFDQQLHYFSHKLLSLHCYANITYPKNGFINLKEVCIGRANYNKINIIIKTAKKLERVHLEFHMCAFTNNNKLQMSLMELFSQNTLEFISIKIKYFQFLQPINFNALQKISFSKRKRLKIRFEIRAKMENVNEYFEILINKFSEDGVIDNWMIIFIFRFVEPMRKYFTENEQHSIGDKVQLVKTNKECKINGWKERWLYYCCRCV